MPHELLVDDEVFKALQERAAPFVDTPNSVLRRVLGLAESEEGPDGWPTPAFERGPSRAAVKSRRRKGAGRRSARAKPRRTPKGMLLPGADYEVPILEALNELGGRAPTSELLEVVGKKLDGKLGPKELERLDSGDIRWKNRAQFVRLALVRSGDMVKNSPRGVWEISDRGRGRLEEKE